MGAVFELDIKVDVFDPLIRRIFIRQNNRVKFLYWKRNGFCLWLKRFESERFKRLLASTDQEILFSV